MYLLVTLLFGLALDWLYSPCLCMLIFVVQASDCFRIVIICHSCFISIHIACIIMGLHSGLVEDCKLSGYA